MASLFIVAFLLAHSFSNAANFDTVYTWNEMDYAWPSKANRAKAVLYGTFEPENIKFEYMAVFGTRIFLSLSETGGGIPVSLVSLPTSSKSSSTSQKLTPFPSWKMHKKDNCDSIQWARGIETDTEGRLWVLDNGSGHCPSKIWIFNLLKNDNTELVHQFPDTVVSHSFSNRYLRDIVIDKTPDDYLAYITDSLSEHIIVYSQNNNLSWPVKTPGYKFSSISLSPEEPKQLYLRISFSTELCSIPVLALAQNGNSPAKTLSLIVTWKESAYRMLIDTNRTMYVAFYKKDYIVARKINKPFNERRIYEIADLSNKWPFTFALDSSGNLWITQLKINRWSRRYSLLKIAVGSKPYIFGSRQIPETSSSVTPITSTLLTTDKSAQVGPHAPQSNVSLAKDTSHEVRDCNNDAKYQSLLVLNTVLSCWNVFSLFSIASQVLWFRKMKKMQDCIAKSKKESEQMCSNPPIYNRIEPDTSEPIYEEVAAVPSTSTSAQRTVAEVYT